MQGRPLSTELQPLLSYDTRKEHTEQHAQFFAFQTFAVVVFKTALFWPTLFKEAYKATMKHPYHMKKILRINSRVKNTPATAQIQMPSNR